LHLSKKIHAFGIGAETHANAVRLEMPEVRRLAAAQKNAGAIGDGGTAVCDLTQFRRGQKGAVREDDAFAQETDRAQVVGTRAAALFGDTFDLTAALRQMHGDQQIAFARDPIDRSQEVGCAGVGCMRAEHDADAATRPFVVVGEQPAGDNDPAGNIDGFSVGRRIGGDVGNAAILDDHRLIPHGGLLVLQRPNDPFGLDDRTRHAPALC